jgi:hypothetical protein
MTHYAITTFGTPSTGPSRSYYLSRERAISDARETGGGSCSTVRVVMTRSRAEAIGADISDPYPVVWQS